MIVCTVSVREKSDEKVPPRREPSSNKMDIFRVTYKIAK